MGYKIRVSSRAIILQDQKILLNCFGDGLYYNFPGGGIEENETALEAVVREVKEESGLDVEVVNHLFTFEYEPTHCNCFEGNNHHISTFFHCKLIGTTEITTPIKPDVNPDDNSKKSHAIWIPISDLSKTPFLPKIILEPLMKYIETGVFEPTFIEQCNHRV